LTIQSLRLIERQQRQQLEVIDTNEGLYYKTFSRGFYNFMFFACAYYANTHICPNLFFVGKTRTIPIEWSSIMCSSHVGCCLAGKWYGIIKVSCSSKCSILLKGDVHWQKFAGKHVCDIAMWYCLPYFPWPPWATSTTQIG
jgi:hypothetical protein